MADSLMQALLTKLGVNMPTAPEVSPDQLALHDEMVKREQAKQSPLRRGIQSAMTAPGEAAAGMFYDPTSAPTDDERNPAFAAGALASVLPFGPKGIKGMYSRVERVAESLPKSINPNKLGSILKSRASGEELGWRKVPEFLNQFSSAKPVEKDALIGHLQDNPFDVKVTEKGEPEHSGSFLDRDYQEFHRDRSNDTAYADYQIPGAKNYRETLIQLASPGQRVDEISKRIDNTHGAEYEALRKELQELSKVQPFQSHHWDEPNVLVHVRHNERQLPLKELPSWADHVQHGSDERFNDAHWVTGRQPDPTNEVSGWTRYNGPNGKTEEEAITKAKLDMGPKGRMLENVQSDWHQKGAHQGYGAGGSGMKLDEAAEASMETARQQLIDRIKTIGADLNFPQPEIDYFVNEQDTDDILHRLREMNRQPGPDGEQAGLTLQSLQEARVAYDNATDMAMRSRENVVPDAPFKDNWAELALKQQLLDIAHNHPDTQWLGIAPSSELRSRGEVISPEFQDKQLPNTLEKLLKQVGGPPVPAKDALWVRGQKTDLGIRPTGGHIDSAGTHIYREDEHVATALPTADSLSAINNTQPLVEKMRKQRPNIEAWIARLTPEMLDKIKKTGFPLATIYAAMMANNKEQ